MYHHPFYVYLQTIMAALKKLDSNFVLRDIKLCHVLNKPPTGDAKKILDYFDDIFKKMEVSYHPETGTIQCWMEGYEFFIFSQKTPHDNLHTDYMTCLNFINGGDFYFLVPQNNLNIVDYLIKKELTSRIDDPNIIIGKCINKGTGYYYNDERMLKIVEYILYVFNKYVPQNHYELIDDVRKSHITIRDVENEYNFSFSCWDYYIKLIHNNNSLIVSTVNHCGKYGTPSFIEEVFGAYIININKTLTEGITKTYAEMEEIARVRELYEQSFKIWEFNHNNRHWEDLSTNIKECEKYKDELINLIR